MTATYTWDVFSTVDGYGSFDPPADWGGYWSQQGPELLLGHQATVSSCASTPCVKESARHGGVGRSGPRAPGPGQFA
jgi:hypothetical protein